MNLEIKHMQDDDPAFLHRLTRLLSETIRQYDPAEVFLVRTDNWFDVKWFAFAGQVKVGIETGIDAINPEVRPVWRTGCDVTVPPFVPNRIVEQTHMLHSDGSIMPAGDNSRLIHPLEKARSSRNIHNRLLDHSPSALFIWFSSKSQSNGRASMMLYRTYEGRVGGWYVSFIRDRDWHVDLVRNKDRLLIERIFNGQKDEDATQQPDGAETP